MSNTVIWRSTVGSHMWGMARPDSDEDIWETYVVPTEDILKGINKGGGSHFSPDPINKIDVAKHEIGKVIYELQKGNLNFITGLMSHIVGVTGPRHDELKEIWKKNPQKGIIHSCRGMARSNLKKYEGKDNAPSRIAKTLRVLKFAHAYFFEAPLPWSPQAPAPYFDTVEDCTWDMVRDAIKELEYLYDVSGWPERPDPVPYQDFLLSVRLEHLPGVRQ